MEVGKAVIYKRTEVAQENDSMQKSWHKKERQETRKRMVRGKIYY